MFFFLCVFLVFFFGVFLVFFFGVFFGVFWCFFLELKVKQVAFGGFWWVKHVETCGV